MSSIPDKILQAMHRDDKNMQSVHGEYEDALELYRKWTKALLAGAPNHPDIAIGITNDVITELPYCGALVSIYQFNLAVSYVPDDLRTFMRSPSLSKIGDCIVRLDKCLSRCPTTPVINTALGDLRESIINGDKQYTGFMEKVNAFIDANTTYLNRSWSKLQHKL